MILGVETSCDETAAALVTAEGEILANVASSQADLHARYGGVVPEIASRRHLELLAPVVKEALAEANVTLADVEAVAVTRGPGLVGALLIGLSGAKAAVERAARICTEMGAKRALMLQVSAPFHSSLMQPAADEMREALAKVGKRASASDT